MVTNGITYSITNTKKVILEKLYMLFQIYVLLSYKHYNIRLRLVRTGKKFCNLKFAETQYDSSFVPQYGTFPNDWQVWTW